MAFFRDKKFSEAIRTWQVALRYTNQGEHLEYLIESAKRAGSMEYRVGLI